MIKNAVLHPVGEQPIVADLFAAPTPSDSTLLCTNLRTIDGKRPIYIDAPDSLFMIPMSTIRFVEVPAEQLAGALSGLAGAERVSRNGNGRALDFTGDVPAAPDNAKGAASRPDDAALVPIAGGELYSVLPDADQAIEMDAGSFSLNDREPDEELLRRIRDI